jgi:hypothetical protein
MFRHRLFGLVYGVYCHFQQYFSYIAPLVQYTYKKYVASLLAAIPITEIVT